MNKYSILSIVNEKDFNEISQCLSAETRSFAKNDIIMRQTNEYDNVGIVKKGLICLISIGEDGEKSIIDYYERGSIFGKGFTPDSCVNLHYIIAKEDCEVTLFSYSRLMSCCSKNCEKHREIINTIIIDSFRRCQMHIDILTGRTIRRKLITYFRYMKELKGNDSFDIPVSLSDLADYLSVDRSAMMREIKKMKNENIIIAKGCKITLSDI